MSRPKDNHYRLTLSKDERTVQITIYASSTEKAIELYEKIERSLIEIMRADLELDWKDDNPQ
jgi:hypothetical protein